MGLMPPELIQAIREPPDATPAEARRMSPEQALASLGFAVRRVPPTRITGQGSRSVYKGKVEARVYVGLPPDKRTFLTSERRMDALCRPEEVSSTEERMLREFLLTLLREIRADAAAKRASLEEAARREAAVAAACAAAGCDDGPRAVPA